MPSSPSSAAPARDSNACTARLEQRQSQQRFLPPQVPARWPWAAPGWAGSLRRAGIRHRLRAPARQGLDHRPRDHRQPSAGRRPGLRTQRQRAALPSGPRQWWSSSFSVPCALFCSASRLVLLSETAASSLGEVSPLFTVVALIWRQRTAKKGLSQGRDEV
jgi:hypothetical protein